MPKWYLSGDPSAGKRKLHIIPIFFLFYKAGKFKIFRDRERAVANILATGVGTSSCFIQRLFLCFGFLFFGVEKKQIRVSFR